MRHSVLIFLMLLSMPAFASDTPPADAKVWTLVGSVNALALGRDRDAILALGAAFQAEVDVTENIRLGFGLGMPTAVGIQRDSLSLSVPLSARIHPSGWRDSGFYLLAQMTPMYAQGTLCVIAEHCQDLPDDPASYQIYGLAVKGGLGAQINFKPAWIFFDLGYVAGPFKGIEASNGYQMSDGTYTGIEVALGVKIPL